MVGGQKVLKGCSPITAGSLVEFVFRSSEIVLPLPLLAQLHRHLAQSLERDPRIVPQLPPDPPPLNARIERVSPR